MTDHPIIFSAPMVRALLDGRKTMTRRLAWHPTRKNIFGAPWASPWQKVRPGDRLWVREAWALLPRNCYALPKTIAPDADMAAYYRADFDRSGRPGWRPSIHMPRWASRLTLTVTATKIEPLQDITASDCYREGIARPSGPILGSVVTERDNAQGAFRKLWNSLHGPDAWTANPECVALTFTVAVGNIDKAAA